MEAATIDRTDEATARPERRAYSRSPVSLFGRFMMPDRIEYPCQVINASPASMGLITAHVGEVGTPCIFYVTHLGRMEGTIARHFPGGMGVRLDTSERKREKLSAKIDWVVNHAKYGTAENRVHERRAPRASLSEVHTPDGRSYRCRIVDISLSGAAMEMDVRFDLGARLILGGLEGIVVRQFDEGCAIEFLNVQRDDLVKRLSG